MSSTVPNKATPPGLNRAATAFIAATIVLSAGALINLASLYPVPPADWLYVLPGLMLATGASFYQMPVLGFRQGQSRSEDSTISLGLLPTFLLLLTFGPLVGALAGAMTAIVATCYPRRSLPVQIAFSIAAVTLAVAACAPVLLAAHLAEPGQPFAAGNALRSEFPIGQAFAVLLAGAVYFGVNSGLVSVVISLTSGRATARGFAESWRNNYLWMLPACVAGAACAALLYVLLPYALQRWQSGLALATLAVPIPFLMIAAIRYHRDRNESARRYIAELETAREELRDLYTATLESFALAIDAKDRYTQAHIQRVKDYAVNIAAEIGLNSDERKAVEYGALLHDIGKIAIPESILCKPGKLTPEEFETMKTHTTIGAKILEPVRFPFPVLAVVRSHHERWDGKGYPDGLRGEEIPIGARILAVADVYDALTTDRAYRRAWSRVETMNHLQKQMGAHFDPLVVSVFLRILRREGAGAMVDGPAAQAESTAGR